MNSQAKADGRSFRISPRTDGNFKDAGVSSDGRIAWTLSPDSFADSKLYLQGLKADGAPTGDPFVVFASAQNLLLDGDVSNPLPGNKRFAAYLTYDPNATNGGSVFVPIRKRVDRSKDWIGQDSRGGIRGARLRAFWIHRNRSKRAFCSVRDQ